MVERLESGQYHVVPVKIENTDKFREAAIRFQKNGYYTAAPKGTSAFIEYWREERKRCLDGYTAPDGDWISGYHYFYLNYCPILLIREKYSEDRKKNKRKVVTRERDFPDFWDSDYNYFMAIDAAESEGKHLVVLKARGKGYSFKGGSMLCRNYFLIPESKSYAIASEMEFLLKDGLLSKAWEFMDFIDQHTGWSKKRQAVNKTVHKRASYIVADDDGTKSEAGYRSEIIGVSLKNDPDKARGKRGKLILWEEGGKFPELIKSWQVAQPSVEDSGVAHGLMIAFGTGGCLTEGNMVWDSKGNLKDIKDLKQEDGILGFDGKEVSDENITWFQEPTKKECVKITTNTGRSIECSLDHPILTATQTKETRGNITGKSFKEANDIKVGNKIAVIEEVPIWGEKRMWNPRVVGWLIGDGSYGKGQTPRISNCEVEINDYIEKNLTHTIRLERETKTGKIYKEIALRGYNQELRDLGIYGQTKLRKTLPKEVHSYSKHDLQEFVGGLFDTDGYVNIRQNRARSGRTMIYEVSISQASLSLLEELRLLLQKFGIHGRIRKREPRENNPKDKNAWYEFTIADKNSLIEFWKNVRLYPKEKQYRLNEIYLNASLITPHREYEGYRYEEVISKEETGIKPVYNLTAGKTHTYIGNGIITHNTDDADYEGLRELFMYPDGYNALPFKNIWDDGGGTCGYFVPEYVNMYGKDSDGRPLQDESGNTEYHIATRHALAKRDDVLKGANDRNAIDRYIAEHPFNPAEACLQLTGNIFPKEELIRHLAYIRNTEKLTNYKQVGDLEWDESGILKWIPAVKPKDIIKYRLKADDNKRGQIVIWEHPVDNPPHGLYIAGCLLPGEKVLTDIGLKNVEDVTLEDKLINKDGEYVNINTLLRYKKKDEDVYKVHMSHVDRPTIYTQEHPLYLSSNPEGEYDFIRMRNVTEDMWTKYPNVYNKEEDESFRWDFYKQPHSIENPLNKKDFWWFVGHWLGDGFNHNQGRNYTIYNSFGKNENEYVNKYKSIVENIFKRKPHLKLQNGSNTHKFEFKQLYLFLEDNFGKYADGKYIAEWVKYLPRHLKLQLILGYLDSDGSVFKDRSLIRASFKSINRKLLNDIQDILFSLGIVSSFNLSDKAGTYNIKGKTGKTKNSYSLQIGKIELKKLVDQYDCDYGSRKLKSAKKIELLQKPRKSNTCIISDDQNYIYLKIKKIESFKYTGTVYNFDCETHTFLCQYCSTHNCDPYDHDQAATSDSLGSVFIYKRFQNFESFYDLIVAEYTGRPDTVNEFYENVRKLLIYFNAKLLYENEKPGLYGHFSNKHSEYLLADQPDYISQIIKNSRVSRKKGVHMVQGIKDEAELKIRDWLNEEYEPGKKNLTKILSEPLIEELISYNRDGNFDRVIAFMMVMLYKEELHNLHVKRAQEEEKENNLFREPLFSDMRVPKFINL